MKKVLMLTAKETEIPFILQAKMLGYYVITTGNAPEQVGHKYGINIYHLIILTLKE